MNRQAGALRRSQRGLTLIELMVVVALVAILGMLSTGSMRGVIERNRIATGIDGFVGDLQFARSEAITRGLPVTLCPSSDGASCLTGDQWQQGWIVFSDPDGSGTVSGPDAVLRRHKAWGANDTFVATPGTGVLTYGRDGFLIKLAGSSATLRAQASSGDTGSARCVSINRVGRQVVQQPGTGDCA